MRLLAGHIEEVEGMQENTWATPYALSIYGEELFDNCPFGTGDGYGDGRAISLGEVVGLDQQKYELQLKGGGQTAFCRGADGRAVIRSSIREFLGSEAMHWLGISTTRALGVVRGSAKVDRPWYKSTGSYRPDVMSQQVTAITCRASPSYIRVGQVELYARRVRKYTQQ